MPVGPNHLKNGIRKGGGVLETDTWEFDGGGTRSRCSLSVSEDTGRTGDDTRIGEKVEDESLLRDLFRFFAGPGIRTALKTYLWFSGDRYVHASSATRQPSDVRMNT